MLLGCARGRSAPSRRKSLRAPGKSHPFGRRVALPASVVAALIALAGGAIVHSARAQTGHDFYSGKTITIIVGSQAGGGYDAQARLLSRHLADHIPGRPDIVVEDMPGAGGLSATNYFVNVGPRDGTELALVPRTALLAKMVAPDAVHFDVTKINWLGSMMSEPGVLMVWRTAPVKSTNELFTRELIVGGAGKLDDSETTPKVLNAVIGAKLKVIGGYPSLTAATLAMERGEVQGVTDWSWSNAKQLKPQYLRDHLASVLMQFNVTRAPDLANVPTPLDFAKNDADRELLRLYFTPKTVSRPVALPPGAPPDRVALLRTAFAQTMEDPRLIADARRSDIPIDFASYRVVDKAIAVINGASPDVLRRLTQIFNAK
jgi:tripartite-type tricarboxylate transporter receptor subunit TctC